MEFPPRALTITTPIRILTSSAAYFQDTWKIKSNFTLNYGLAWNAQTGFYLQGVPLPQYLSPILGTGNNLQPTQNNLKEFSPAFGFAWSPGKNQKWVIRGGGGIYWDGTPGYYKLRAASSIEPPGAQRNTLAASAFTNIYPGLLNIGAGGIPIPVGASLPLSALTNMTIGQFENLVNLELPAIEAQISPPNAQRSGPITVSGIDLIKQGVEIYPHSFPLARSYQTNLGFQRELPWGMVLGVDWARRQGENVSQGELDLNHFNLYEGSTVPHPVIPVCAPNQVYVAGIECSSGSITFWYPQGRAIYNGMLVKLQKRFSHHASFQASYALQSASADTAPWNVINPASAYGQYLSHNNFNFAGTYELKWGFLLSVNSSFISRTPLTASVNGLILPGTDAVGSTEPLPGIGVGSLNAGTDKAGLIAAVQAFNATYAGTLNAQGARIGALQVPTHFQFGDPIYSQDFRLTKKFTFREKYSLSIIGEMFNAFNIANLSYPSFTLDPAGTTTPAFGQPTQRVGQSLGQGGPRAVQVGARFQF